MTMALPFALGLVAAALAVTGRRALAGWAWLATMIVLLAWFYGHLTSHIDVAL